MKNILHFDMKSNALLSGVPYLIMWLFSIVSSMTVDYIIGKNYLSTTVARKIANTIATMGPALALLGKWKEMLRIKLSRIFCIQGQHLPDVIIV